MEILQNKATDINVISSHNFLNDLITCSIGHDALSEKQIKKLELEHPPIELEMTLDARAAMGLMKKLVIATLILCVVVMVVVIAPSTGYGKHAAITIQQYLW